MAGTLSRLLREVKESSSSCVKPGFAGGSHDAVLFVTGPAMSPPQAEGGRSQRRTAWVWSLRERTMRRERHIHPEEIMRPDLLSEVVLAGAVVVVVSLLFTLLRALP